MPEHKIPKPPEDFTDDREHRRKIAIALNTLIQNLENGDKSGGPSVLDWLRW